jgi:hypothetical protein
MPIRQLERPELRDDENVNAEQGHTKGCAHVAESDPGHFPFTIPEQHGLSLALGLAMKTDLRPNKHSPVLLLNRVADRQHAVERRLVGTGEFGHHHFGWPAVVPEDRKRGLLKFEADNVAKLDNTAFAG